MLFITTETYFIVIQKYPKYNLDFVGLSEGEINIYNENKILLYYIMKSYFCYMFFSSLNPTKSEFDQIQFLKYENIAESNTIRSNIISIIWKYNSLSTFWIFFYHYPIKIGGMICNWQ